MRCHTIFGFVPQNAVGQANLSVALKYMGLTQLRTSVKFCAIHDSICYFNCVRGVVFLYLHPFVSIRLIIYLEVWRAVLSMSVTISAIFCH